MRPFNLRKPWAWLLTLGWPVGQQLRLSSRPVSIATRAGRSLQYGGGLPPLRWRNEAPLFEVAVGQGSLAVDVDLGDDYAARAHRHPLEGCAAELAIHFLGQVHEARHVVFRGHVDRAVLGVERQKTSLEIVEESFEDGGLLVSEEWVITAADWANAVENALGQVYPRVYGTPGAYRGTSGGATVAGSPCWIVSYTGLSPITGVIAGHHVAASAVTVLNGTTGNMSARSVTNTSISTGTTRRAIATVNLFPLSDFGGAATETDDYYVIWSGSGATYNLDRTKAVLGAGELLQRVLASSSLPIDRGRLAAARGVLDRYRLDTYANTTVSPWEWVRRAVLPLVPVSVVSGPSGIYPVPWRLDADPSHAVAHLEIGRTRSWASRDEPGDAEHYTEVRVSLAPDDDTGELQRLVRVRPEDRTSNDTGTCSHARRAVQGRATYQAAAVPVLLEHELDQTHDADTAWLFAHDKLRLGFRPGRLVEVDVDRELSGLELGDVVTVTGTARSWARRVGHVGAVEWASGYTRTALYVPYQ